MIKIKYETLEIFHVPQSHRFISFLDRQRFPRNNYWEVSQTKTATGIELGAMHANWRKVFNAMSSQSISPSYTPSRCTLGNGKILWIRSYKTVVLKNSQHTSQVLHLYFISYVSHINEVDVSLLIPDIVSKRCLGKSFHIRVK